MNHYDTIIIGAGHNGLVAAAYLAKQGKKVLVLERRAIVGGSVVTESFGEDFKADSIYAGGTLRPDIIKDLKLASYGLRQLIRSESHSSPFKQMETTSPSTPSPSNASPKKMRRAGVNLSALWISRQRSLRRLIPRSCRACQRISVSAMVMAWQNGDSNYASRAARTCSTSSAPCR